MCRWSTANSSWAWCRCATSCGSTTRTRRRRSPSCTTTSTRRRRSGRSPPDGNERAATCEDLAWRSDTHHVIAVVHVQDLAGDAARALRHQEQRRVRDLAGLRVALERRTLAEVIEDRREVGDAGGGERLDGTGRD